MLLVERRQWRMGRGEVPGMWLPADGLRSGAAGGGGDWVPLAAGDGVRVPGVIVPGGTPQTMPARHGGRCQRRFELHTSAD
jgi:hypothetical protein